MAINKIRHIGIGATNNKHQETGALVRFGDSRRLVNISGELNKGVPLPPGQIVLPGNLDEQGNFNQTGVDIICKENDTSSWCEKYSGSDYSIISKTVLTVQGSQVNGSLVFAFGSGGFGAETTVQMSGILKDGVYNIHQVGNPAWNMQLKEQS